MIRPAPFWLALVLGLAPAVARAEEPKPPPDEALAFITGASIFVLGLGAGSVIVASSERDSAVNVGWLGMNTALVAAPLFAHGVADEWGRGLVFSAAPAVSLAGTGTLFAIDSGAIRHGSRTEQRFVWSFLTGAVLTSAAGVIDAAFAGERRHTLSVVPQLGPGMAGLEVWGTL